MDRRGFSNRLGLRWARLIPLLALSGCSTRAFWLFHPRGAVAAAEFHVMLLDVGIMLAIVLTAGLMALVFLYRYRKPRRQAYDPTFVKSNRIEVLVWGVPLLTVGVLAYFSYQAVFATNPYHPKAITRYEKTEARKGMAVGPAGALRPAITVPGKKPVHVDVITTDWQWLFIYPHRHIASLNKLVVPVGTPVDFRLTSATVVNDFFIPKLVGEIDVMPGMRTKQAMIVSKPGVYSGYSADYSGGGFSWMEFVTKVVTAGQYRRWTHRMAHARRSLTDTTFNRIAAPTINLAHTPKAFAHVQPGLFRHVVQRVMQGKVYATPTAMTENMKKPRGVRVIH